MSLTVVAYLDKEALLALCQFKEDISVVAHAAGAHGTSPLLLRHALRCATEAFGALGDARHPAWSELVTAVDDLLIYRSQFAAGIDDNARARLRDFVNENVDALPVREHHLVAS